MSEAALIRTLKQEEQDFEWYPTTQEMLETLHNFMQAKGIHLDSMLDIGAGDGRILRFFEEKHSLHCHAIEKSRTLIERMDSNVLVVGSDFYQTSLIEKEHDFVFCNPPYSEFKAWMMRILREANAHYIALIIPSRWKEDNEILNTIQNREGLRYEIVANRDFLDAPRAARANVDIVFLTTAQSSRNKEFFANILMQDFKLDTLFKKLEKSSWESEKQEKEALNEECKEIEPSDLIAFLTKRYEAQYLEFVQSLESLHNINPKILQALDINKDKLIKGIKKQLQDLKYLYWNELFNKLHSLKRRVIPKYRSYLSQEVISRAGIDFCKENIYNIVLWVIKNTNRFIELGYTEFFDFMAHRSGVSLYKSNKRFSSDEWRYCKDKELRAQPHKLDYRIVLPYLIAEYRSDDLSDVFLETLDSVARNLGFVLDEWRARELERSYNYTLRALHKGHCIVFCEIKTYKNGNAHIKFNKDFMCALNIAVGKLHNWIKNKAEAKEEFKCSDELIDEVFARTEQKSLQAELQRLALPLC